MGNPGWFRSPRVKGWALLVKNLLTCLVLGFAVLIANVAVVGCGGTTKDKEKDKEEKKEKDKKTP